MLFIVSAAIVLAAQPIDLPVREWRQPGLQINVAEAALRVRGHVASTAHAETLLAGTAATDVQTELWRHVALPAHWQDISARLFNIARQLQSGQATLTRDAIKLNGLVEQHTGIDAQLKSFERSLPDGLGFDVDLQLLYDETPEQACETLQASLVLDDLLFDRNSSRIRGGDIARLNRIADVLRRCPHYQLIAVGHSDGIGSDHNGRVVSKLRATAVTDYLQSLNIPADRFTVRGEGKAAPVASNATWEGRNLNRRVTLELYSVVPSAGP